MLKLVLLKCKLVLICFLLCSDDAVSVILLIVPAIYEKHGDIIDILGEKALFELNNLYADLMKKFFGKSQHLQECFLD